MRLPPRFLDQRIETEEVFGQMWISLSEVGGASGVGRVNCWMSCSSRSCPSRVEFGCEERAEGEGGLV